MPLTSMPPMDLVIMNPSFRDADSLRAPSWIWAEAEAAGRRSLPTQLLAGKEYKSAAHRSQLSRWTMLGTCSPRSC